MLQPPSKFHYSILTLTIDKESKNNLSSFIDLDIQHLPKRMTLIHIHTKFSADTI